MAVRKFVWRLIEMKKTTRLPRARLAFAACTIATLSACVVTPAPMASNPYGYATTPGGVYAPIAPPTPQYEVQPALPFLGAIWIAGFWNWLGGRHVWVSGHYEQPRPGYRWAPHQWVQSPRGGWELHGGGWVR
jgi:hypothetical protein